MRIFARLPDTSGLRQRWFALRLVRVFAGHVARWILRLQTAPPVDSDFVRICSVRGFAPIRRKIFSIIPMLTRF
jgi:hypothetical protein